MKMCGSNIITSNGSCHMHWTSLVISRFLVSRFSLSDTMIYELYFHATCDAFFEFIPFLSFHFLHICFLSVRFAIDLLLCEHLHAHTHSGQRIARRQIPLFVDWNIQWMLCDQIFILLEWEKETERRIKLKFVRNCEWVRFFYLIFHFSTFRWKSFGKLDSTLFTIINTLNGLTNGIYERLSRDKRTNNDQAIHKMKTTKQMKLQWGMTAQEINAPVIKISNEVHFANSSSYFFSVDISFYFVCCLCVGFYFQMHGSIEIICFAFYRCEYSYSLVRSLSLCLSRALLLFECEVLNLLVVISRRNNVFFLPLLSDECVHRPRIYRFFLQFFFLFMLEFFPFTLL